MASASFGSGGSRANLGTSLGPLSTFGRSLLGAAIDMPPLQIDTTVDDDVEADILNACNAMENVQRERECNAMENARESDGCGTVRNTPKAECPPASAGWALLRASLAIGARLRAVDDIDEEPDSPRSIGEDRQFEIADELEGGMARETTTDFMAPLRRGKKLWRFRVVRSADRFEHRLYSDAGDFLMFALISMEQSRISFFQYDPEDPQVVSHKSLYDISRPSLVLTFNKNKTQWELTQERCENCYYQPAQLSCAMLGKKQQVTSVLHRRHAVGQGVSNEMDACIPGIYSTGNRVLWCLKARGMDLAAAPSGDHMTHQLITKRPSWNDNVECLVLDFKGRNVLASAKNFQLALRQKPEHVILQYGKLSATNFALDIRFPLSIIQAFAISMTTVFWT